VRPFYVRRSPVVSSSLTVSAGSPQSVAEGGTLTLTGSVSGGTPPYTTFWSYGDGPMQIDNASTSHQYNSSGTLESVFAAVDSAGNIGAGKAAITVTSVAPVAKIWASPYGLAGEPVTLVAGFVDPGYGAVQAGFTYAWTLGDTNTATTQIVNHTYSAAGTYNLTLVITNAAGTASNTATFSITISSPSNVTIDSTWLTANGPEPYLLLTNNTIYTLAQDVTVLRTGFIFLGKNQVLDLGGHTLNYDTIAPISFTNGGFETGDTTGWNVTGANSAQVVPVIPYMWGNYCLEFNNASSNQTIISSPVTLPTTTGVGNGVGFEYNAAITILDYTVWASIHPSQVDQNYIYVIDNVTQAVLGSQNQPQPARGFCAWCQFTTTSATPNPVVMQVVNQPAASSTDISYLDYAEITHSRNFGVVASTNGNAYPQWLKNISAINSNIGHQHTSTVRNGTITQGQGKSWAGNAIMANTGMYVTADTITTNVWGLDCRDINMYYCTMPVVRNCTCQPNLDRITDRMSLFGSIFCESAYGAIVVQDNSVSGTTHIGTVVSRQTNAYTEPAIVSGNTFTYESLWTEGYCIAVEGLQNFEIYDNTGNIPSGRGLLIDSNSTGQLNTNGRIHDNSFTVMEHPNLEYASTGLDACALRIRNASLGYYRNLYFYNNEFFSSTQNGYAYVTCGALIGERNPGGNMNFCGTIFDNNHFKAIVISIDPSQQGGGKETTGWAISHSTNDTGMWIVYKNNIFESNAVSANFGDDNGSFCYNVDEQSNTYTKSSEGATLVYMPIQCGYNNNIAIQNRMFSPTYTGGAASSQISFHNGTGNKQLSLGWTLSVYVTDGSSAQVGAFVVVLDNTGAIVFAGVTDGSGNAAGILAVVTVLTQAGVQGQGTLITTQMTPLKIWASTSTKTGSITATPTADTSYTVTVA